MAEGMAEGILWEMASSVVGAGTVAAILLGCALRERLGRGMMRKDD